MTADLHDGFVAAARLIDGADALIVAAGAGMGIDSGLPDFRGPGGFWQVYPALGRAGLQFEEIASPAAFRRDPALAWGFYGHRLQLYRRTRPHPGYAILRCLAGELPRGGFVFTSNVDGQFQRAGFAESHIEECHGSIHHLQCLERCTDAIWPADGFVPDIDEECCRLRNPPPRCPNCAALARPAILMFDDRDWADGRSRIQAARQREWRRGVARPVVVELGAGSAIATVRRYGEGLNCPLIRVNPSEWQAPNRRTAAIGLACGALEGLQGIMAVLAGASS